METSIAFAGDMDLRTGRGDASIWSATCRTDRPGDDGRPDAAGTVSELRRTGSACGTLRARRGVPGLPCGDSVMVAITPPRGPNEIESSSSNEPYAGAWGIGGYGAS